MFKECINQATVLSSDIITFIKASYEAKFNYIELDISKVLDFLQKHNLKLLKQEILNHGLEVVSLNAIENIPIYTEAEFNAALEYVRKIIALCQRLSCKILVINPNEVPKHIHRNEALNCTINFLKQVTEIASKEDIKIGFEYVGFKNRIINNFEDTLKLNEIMNSEYFGLVLDVFHLYITNTPFELIKKIPTNKLWIIHINDVPQKPIEILTDKDRLFPGEGIIDLLTFMRILRDLNYNGYISIELFNEKYWKENPFDVVRKARESLKSLLCSNLKI
jgi:2-keto-myo-inositol isomerase